MVTDGRNIFFIAIYFATAYYYSSTVISMTYALKNSHVSRGKTMRDSTIFFLINLIFFDVFDLFDSNLINNYILFPVILLLEEYFIFKMSKDEALFISLYISLCTLCNMLFYCTILSMINDNPISYYEGIIYSDKTSKFLVLSITSISTSFAFRHYSKEKNCAPLRHLTKSLNQLRYLMMIMVLLIAYLIMQGNTYMNMNNSMLGKLWGLSGCIFVSMGFLFSMRYAVRLSYLYYLDKKNIELQKKLDEKTENIADLIDSADIDDLTKVRNRRAGDRVIFKWTEEKKNFVVCMIDLDSLKYVNDNIGHIAGDKYIVSVVDIIRKNCRQDRDMIYRFGGDEFIVAFYGLPVKEVVKRMGQIYQEVILKGEEEKIPMRISYGVVVSDGKLTAENIIAEADKKMYNMKNQHKKDKHYAR